MIRFLFLIPRYDDEQNLGFPAWLHIVSMKCQRCIICGLLSPQLTLPVLSLVYMQFIRTSTLFFSVFCLLLNRVSAQQLFLDQQTPVIVMGDTLAFPWTGGFNSIVPVEIDLNSDAVNDLFFLDRVGNRISTFINDGTTGLSAYRYDPAFASVLPPLRDWVRSADYDCDGDLDLFTYANSSISVWRNDLNNTSSPAFVPAYPQLNSWYSTFFNPIFVSQVNLPAITDVDGDSDFDIITFSSSGNYLEYHRNYAFDSLGVCDTFLFSLEPYCWGYFKLSGLSNVGLLNQNCRMSQSSGDSGLEFSARHSGSVLTPLDQDCDGDVDLLNGDILGENMLFLLNGGTPDSAVIVQQDPSFPVYDVPVNMQNLPGAYYLDLNNDGLKDMLVSPFATVGEDYNNLHLYNNSTNNCSNIFNFTTSRFLSDQTIDQGTAANPAFFDVDQDGLTDLVVGNDLYFNTDPNLAVSRLAWYRNTGSVTAPVFTLADDNWLQLSAFSQYALFPSFGDLDADGDADLLLGNSDGSLIQFTNTAGTGNPCNFVFTSAQYQGIDIGNNSTPQIIDVNRDGKNDLLVGERSGVINYFENTGTAAAPVFISVSSTLGGVSVVQSGAITGYSAPLLFESQNGYHLLVGSESGNVFHYGNIDGNLNGNFTLIDSSYQSIQELKRVVVSMADINGDTVPEIIAGCNAGGLRLYSSSSPSALADPDQNLRFVIAPNPAVETVSVFVSSAISESPVVLSIYNLQGVMIRQLVLQDVETVIDISDLSAGCYLLSVKGPGRGFVQKLMKLK